jgi:hypothetical protein
MRASSRERLQSIFEDRKTLIDPTFGFSPNLWFAWIVASQNLPCPKANYICFRRALPPPLEPRNVGASLV